MKISTLLSLLLLALVGQATTSYKLESTVQKAVFNKKALDIRGGAKNAKKTNQKIPAFKPSTTGASVPNEIFNLVKAIVGVGVLSLPAGKSVCPLYWLQEDFLIFISPAHSESRGCCFRERPLCDYPCCYLDRNHWYFERLWFLYHRSCMLLHWCHFLSRCLVQECR
jgi:hypothetical protein